MNIKSMAARTGAAAAVAMVPLMLVSQVSGASPSTLYVSPGGTNTNNNCRVALNPCQTITHALTEAPSGATIKVQAGTYDEQVAITQPVTIEGAGPSQTVIEPSAVPNFDADTDTSLPQFYVVDVYATAGVNLKNLGINGSAATPTLDTDGFGCGQDYVGVYYHDAGGSMTNDSVTGMQMPVDLFGCQGGLGVYAATDNGSPTPSVLSMTSDNVSTYDKNGITCDDPGTVCSVKNTTVTGIGSTTLVAQNGIQIWAAAASLSSNVITDNTYDGPGAAAAGILVGNPYTLSVKANDVTHNDSNIYLLQDQTPAWVFCGDTGNTCTNPAKVGTTFTFTANQLSDATNADDQPVGSGYGDGLDLDSVTQATTLNRNVTDNDPGNGISLYGATSVLAKANVVRNNDNGIYLGLGTTAVTANADTLRRNTVSSSLNDGILADSSSGANTIVRNSSGLNANLDAQDNSTGAGTAGTANLWEANNCTTSDPSGLCHTAAGPRAAPAHRTRARGRPATSRPPDRRSFAR